MATDITEAIEQIMQERGISEELALQIVKDTLLAAYKRKFGIKKKSKKIDGDDELDEQFHNNAVIKFDDSNRQVTILVRKKVVNGVYDPVVEIELDEARQLDPEAEEGDDLLIELNPKKDFERSAVQAASQIARYSMREIRKDSLYSEYKGKVGDLIIGYYQRERNGTIYVDLGKIEGVLPKKFQSPREDYHAGERIKALIWKVEKTETGLQIVLSRTHTEFVKAIFETEIPEIYDKAVEILKTVREPGYRTKIAVRSTTKDIDPVSACIGPKGVRIQAIIRELECEKIDVIAYDVNPVEYIKNALSPAKVDEVVVLDDTKHTALAVVPDNQLSLAIGKQGLNVRLANRLVDWSIDVKTTRQYESSTYYTSARKAASKLFNDETDEEEMEIFKLSELPDVDVSAVAALHRHGIDFIEDFVTAVRNNTLPQDNALKFEQIQALRAIIDKLQAGDYPAEEADQSDQEPAVPTVDTPEQSESVATPAQATSEAPAPTPAPQPNISESAIENAEPPTPDAPQASAQPITEKQMPQQSTVMVPPAGEIYECPECHAKITFAPGVTSVVCPQCHTPLTLEEE